MKKAYRIYGKLSTGSIYTLCESQKEKTERKAKSLSEVVMVKNFSIIGEGMDI